MLSRYDGKRVRVVTEDGCAFTGTAESFSSGYGLHVFDREEEGVEVDGTAIFLSQIAKIEPLPQAEPRLRSYDALVGELLEKSYWIADILPAQVPRDAPGQYFAVDRYYRQPERMLPLRRKQAEVLLRLNCYFDMTVSFDGGESWEENPEPERFAERLRAISGPVFLRALFPAQEAMIDIEPDDTWMTVTAPDGPLLETLRQLAAAEGLFLWQPPEES